MNVKNNFRNRYSLIRHILHATARNSCFEDDCFLLLCWRDQQASRITLRLIFGYLDFAPATEQLVQPLLWFQGLAPQSLGWQTCQKPPGLFHLCQKHLTEVTAHVRAQLGPVNHYQNDQKKKNNLLREKGWGERWARPLGFCWLCNPVPLAQLPAILSPILGEHHGLSGCIWWCILRIANLLECFGSQDKSRSSIIVM